MLAKLAALMTGFTWIFRWLSGRQQAKDRANTQLHGAELADIARHKKHQEVRKNADKKWNTPRDTSPRAVLERLRRAAAAHKSRNGL